MKKWYLQHFYQYNYLWFQKKKHPTNFSTPCVNIYDLPIFFTHIIIIHLFQISPDKVASLQPASDVPPYLNLVCDVGEIKRAIARVLVSQHRGYIFIQTDQPMYNPTQKGTTEITHHSFVCSIDTSIYHPFFSDKP